MKKWQMWTIVAVCAVLIAAATGGLYWYLTKDNVKEETGVVERTTEQKELDSVKKDLDATADLDTAEVDDAVKELESVDLSGV